MGSAIGGHSDATSVPAYARLGGYNLLHVPFRVCIAGIPNSRAGVADMRIPLPVKRDARKHSSTQAVPCADGFPNWHNIPAGGICRTKCIKNLPVICGEAKMEVAFLIDR